MRYDRYQEAAVILVNHPSIIARTYTWRPDCPCALCLALDRGKKLKGRKPRAERGDPDGPADSPEPSN